MRGKHIRNKIRDTQATLNTLGFGDFGDRLLDKVMEKFARNKKINYADIDKYLSKYFIQWLCREAKLDGKDTEKILGSATVTDFRDLARNVFILDKFVGVTDKKVVVRGAVTLDPLETLVTLNTYKQVASMALPSNSQPPGTLPGTFSLSGSLTKKLFVCLVGLGRCLDIMVSLKTLLKVN